MEPENALSPTPPAPLLTYKILNIEDSLWYPFSGCGDILLQNCWLRKWSKWYYCLLGYWTNWKLYLTEVFLQVVFFSNLVLTFLDHQRRRHCRCTIYKRYIMYMKWTSYLLLGCTAMLKSIWGRMDLIDAPPNPAMLWKRTRRATAVEVVTVGGIRIIVQSLRAAPYVSTARRAHYRSWPIMSSSMWAFKHMTTMVMHLEKYVSHLETMSFFRYVHLFSQLFHWMTFMNQTEGKKNQFYTTKMTIQIDNCSALLQTFSDISPSCPMWREAQITMVLVNCAVGDEYQNECYLNIAQDTFICPSPLWLQIDFAASAKAAVKKL